VPGGGAAAVVSNQRVLVGTAKFLESEGVIFAGETGRFTMALGAERAAAITAVLFAINGKIAGVISLADIAKASAPAALRELREQGTRIVMLSGDRQDAAQFIAKQLQIDEVKAEVLPSQKAEIIREMRKDGRSVAMAGDGVNDAPALAAANVGIAMGTGSDVSIESAGIVLLKGDLRALVRAQKLSKATIRNIRQNLAFAFLYNIIGIPIAAGVLYPHFGLLLSPMIASAAMSFSSVSVIANALRLRKATL
jgi:Cu+-exporting ATPase